MQNDTIKVYLKSQVQVWQRFERRDCKGQQWTKKTSPTDIYIEANQHTDQQLCSNWTLFYYLQITYLYFFSHHKRLNWKLENTWFFQRFLASFQNWEPFFTQTLPVCQTRIQLILKFFWILTFIDLTDLLAHRTSRP